MNSVMGINAATPNVTFGNKMSKAEKEALNMVNKYGIELPIAIENSKRCLEEQREIAFRDSLKYLKLKCPYFGKLIEKGKATIEHINRPFRYIREIRFQQYEQFINKAVEDGVMDAEQAGELLIKADPKIKKV